jgi:hypothetical protein
MTSFKDTSCIEILPNFKKPNRGKNPALSFFCENRFCLIFLTRGNFAKPFSADSTCKSYIQFSVSNFFAPFLLLLFTWHHAFLGNTVEP